MSVLPDLDPLRLSDLVNDFAGQRVLVVGDMVADEYILGRPARISREAPVVVLEFAGRRLVPGGATNVAVNVRSLGAAARVVGVLGDDHVGRELVSVLQEQGISTEGLVFDPGRPTSTKTRIVGGGSQVVQQQMVRIDRLDSSPLRGGAREGLLQVTASALSGATALILSDYEHGVIDPEVVDLCLPRAIAAGLVVTVDAHGGLQRFRGATLATPNQPEAEAALGRPLADSAALEQGGRELLGALAVEGLLITRGSLGMAVFDAGGLFIELPAFNALEVRDATGAGDTVAAVATLALASGASILEAAMLGNLAAGLAVRRFGATSISRAELVQAIQEYARLRG